MTPVWSRNGKRIAFVSSRDGISKKWTENMEIYVMDTDGTNVRRLTFNNRFDAHPNW